MNPTPETAIVLAGSPAAFHGYGLAPYPKLFLPLAKRPLLHFQAQVLAAMGVKRLILCVKEGMGAAVAERLAAPVPGSLEVLCRETSFGPGGSLKEVEGDIQGGAFWVLNGDLLPGAGLDEMLAFHQETRAAATVGVLRVREAPWEMERVEYDTDQRVRTIHRIHPAQERRSTLRPAGLYLFQTRVLEVIPAAVYFDLKEQLFDPLYQHGMTARFWEMPENSRSITSIGDYFSANQDVLSGRVPVPDQAEAPAATVPTQISPSAQIIAPVAIGAGTRIGDDAIVLGPTAIGANCELAPQTVVNECVILDNVRIKRGAYLHRCVVGEGQVVARMASVHESAIMHSLSDPSLQVRCPLREHGRNHPGHLVGPLAWQTVSGRIYRRVKRSLDLATAALGLVIIAPLLLVIALAIKLDSPGDIIFRQERCGQGGRTFTMYKFRTMVQNSEDLKRELLDLNEVDGPMFKIIADPRVTRVGRFLRETNLDELPQLFNVLVGDMSLVGPRPLSADEMRYHPMWRDARLSVRPGMTGLWQVKAHTKVYFSEWIMNDLEYVMRCSFWFDTKILFKTMMKMFTDPFHRPAT